MNLINGLKKHAPTILSIAASAGVVATFILTARKAEEVSEQLEELDEPTKKEELALYAKTYAPAIGVGLATILCVIFSNHLNKKQQASLYGAYMLMYQNHERYKKKLKDLYGKEVHERIIKELAVESANSQDISAPGITGLASRKIGDTKSKRLFYDRYSDRYFESTIEDVMEAEYHLNRNYSLRGCVAVNEFYIFLGVDPVQNGNRIGWDGSNEHEGIWWIDFNHDVMEIAVNDDQFVDCVVIDMVFDPCYLENEYFFE